MEVLGLWNMGDPMFHDLLSPIEAKRLIKEAYKTGITTFDTAYSYGNADCLLSSAMKEIKAERDSYAIWTKVMPVPTLRKKTETSLRRLNTDYVDGLMLHWPSDEESVFTSLKALESLKEEGKAKELGVSNFPLTLLKKVTRDFPITLHERTLSPVWTKDYEEETKLGLKTLAYGPGAFGLLGRKALPEDSRKELSFLKEESYQKIQAKCESLAEENQVSIYEIAYSFVASLSPYAIIRGASRKEQLQLHLLVLKEEDLKELKTLSEELNKSYPRDNIFSHNYLPV